MVLLFSLTQRERSPTPRSLVLSQAQPRIEGHHGATGGQTSIATFTGAFISFLLSLVFCLLFLHIPGTRWVPYLLMLLGDTIMAEKRNGLVRHEMRFIVAPVDLLCDRRQDKGSF